MVTKEALEKRKAEVVAAREHHLANANAASGAMAECDHWLSVLAAAEAKPDDQSGEFGKPVDNDGATPV